MDKGLSDLLELLTDAALVLVMVGLCYIIIGGHYGYNW